MANVLVIGANSAVASELARRYARNGDKLFLIARSEDKLKGLNDELKDSVIGSFAFDFNDTKQAENAILKACEVLKRIDLAVIAHGYLGDQIQSENDFDHAYDVIHTNYINVIAFLIPIANQLKKQNSGKIAVLLSVAGDRGRPRNFTYGSAKGAVNTYLQGLRSTLYDTNVEVYGFKLGPIDTPMTIDHEKNFSFSTVDTVVTKLMEGLNKRRYTQYVPGYWFWVMLCVRLMPEFLFQRLKFLSDR